MTDGTSHTAAVSEQISGPNGSRDSRGMWWYSSDYEHYYNPNTPNDVQYPGCCDTSKVFCTDTAADWAIEHRAAGSYHPGGVNVGLADGSVGFVNDTVNLLVWQALGSINGAGMNPEETNPDF